MLQTLFGVTVPLSSAALDAPRTARLTARMTEAAAALRDDAPVALAAALRQDARRYLDARRAGTLRLATFGATRACDDTARALLQLTVDVPPMPGRAETLVA